MTKQDLIEIDGTASTHPVEKEGYYRIEGKMFVTIKNRLYSVDKFGLPKGKYEYEYYTKEEWVEEYKREGLELLEELTEGKSLLESLKLIVERYYLVKR